MKTQLKVLTMYNEIKNTYFINFIYKFLEHLWGITGFA